MQALPVCSEVVGERGHLDFFYLVVEFNMLKDQTFLVYSNKACVIS